MLLFVRLIGDRFVFVYCLRGFVRVYDLQSLLHQQKRERASAHEKEEDEWLYQFDMLRDQGPMSHLVTDQCQVFLFGSSAQGVVS